VGGHLVRVRLHDVAEIKHVWHPILEMFVKAVVGWDGYILAWSADLEEIARDAARDAIIRKWWR